jgi:cytochrome d ubiquinol oxidase subunit II
MGFQVLWFILWAVLWAVYFMLDGFDFGVGILHNFLGKDESERSRLLNTIGPVWDGNEVWLITAGGATFAAFPTVYALMFSYLYTPLLLILFALIFRGVGLEFRSKVESPRWKRSWDMVIFASSLFLAILFGVAFGNIFQGLPMDGTGYHGSFLALLNPYGLLTAVLFVLLFLVHGALWLGLKTDGELRMRAMGSANQLWYPLISTAVVFLAASKFFTPLLDNYFNHPVLFFVPCLALLWLVGLKFYAVRNRHFDAFIASSMAIAMLFSTGIVGLYPNLLPSSLDPEQSLTLFNASSSLYTLKVMTVVAMIFVPIVIGYQVWIHRIFGQKVTKNQSLEDPGSY